MRKDIGNSPKKQSMTRNLMTTVVTVKKKQSHRRAEEKMNLHLAREKIIVVGRKITTSKLKTKGPRKKNMNITGQGNIAGHIKEMTDLRKAIDLRNLDLSVAQVMIDPEATGILAEVQTDMTIKTGRSMTLRRGAES